MGGQRLLPGPHQRPGSAPELEALLGGAVPVAVGGFAHGNGPRWQAIRWPEMLVALKTSVSPLRACRVLPPVPSRPHGLTPQGFRGPRRPE